VRESEAVADRQPALDADPRGIVRRFLAWTQRADAEGRADAASALARAYLYSDLDAEARGEAALGLTALLDDPSALVRRALAEALASAADAPHHIVLALACDQSEVASVILARSPVLSDAELVDCAAVGDLAAQTALARRPRLSLAVAAALAEIGARDAVLALAENHEADLPEGALWRILERFGDDAEMREALLTRPWAPAALRNALAAATAKALGEFAARCEWLGAPRAERIVRDAREQATITIAVGSDGAEIEDLVRRMREAGTLTVAVLMRALLCGERGFFVRAMVELSGMAERRVAGFARSPASHGFGALYAKAGLPPAYLPAFRAAVASSAGARGDRVLRSRAERVIETIERDRDLDAAPMRSLLARLAAEAAREEARAFAEDAMVFEEPLLRIVSADAPSYAPLLLSAVAAALEEGEAMEEGVAPPIEANAPSQEFDEDRAPPVQLPTDLLDALAVAA